MTIERISRAIAIAVLATAGVPGSGAAVDTVPADDQAPEVRVVNNNASRIRVVLVDAEGRHRSLGRVAPRKAEIFTLDDTAFEAVRVKIVIDEPVWSAANSGDAIRSRTLWLEEASAIHVWVERELTDSHIEVRSGPGA